ncbi:unnamed protein product [Mucor fragilis]
MYRIHLPKSNLSLLMLGQATLREGDPGDFVAYCVKMQSESSLQGDCYVEISVLCFDIVFYCKLNGFSAPVKMTAQEFESRQNKNTTPCISIACDCLLCIAIRLGDIDVDLNIAILWETFTADRHEIDLALTDDLSQFLETALYFQPIFKTYTRFLASIL